MNIIFSSDDNYARHLGVAIYSILQHNKTVETIHFYVINNRIHHSNTDKLELIVKEYENADISFIPFDSFENQLHLNLSWPISLSSYARLFIGEVLPEKIDRVLYLDCDVVVNGSIEELWDIDLKGNCLGAIQDTIPSKTKSEVGLLHQQSYFNAGVLLIDLEQWRSKEIGRKCLDFIASHKGRVKHHDQGVLNGVLKEQWERLPLKFNVMTIHYVLSQSRIHRFYNDKAPFYNADEVYDAIKSPVILHYTPSLTSRPWEKNCKHPLQNVYKDYLDCTPWKDYPLIKDNSPWYVHLINLRYRYLPF